MSQKSLPVKTILAVIILGVIALFLGSQWYRSHAPLQESELRVAGLVDATEPLKPFHLTDMNGQAFTNNNLMGHWTLLFFGFTNCPNICPTTMTVLNQVFTKLTAEHQALPTVMFISVDPDRDTLPRIKAYATGFNPAFQGATGTKTEIDQLTTQLGVLYTKVQQASGKADSNNYTVDHSGTLMLINPQGKLRAVFSMPHNADNIAADLPLIMSHS